VEVLGLSGYNYADKTKGGAVSKFDHEKLTIRGEVDSLFENVTNDDIHIKHAMNSNIKIHKHGFKDVGE